MALPRCMPGTVGRWTLLVFGISAAPALAGHLPICRAGQFIVDQQLPLTAQGNEPLLVVLSHRRVSLGSICGPARAHLRHRKAGTALRVVWRSCRGAASVRLKAILTHSCWDLSGIIDVRRPRARADLTATSRLVLDRTGQVVGFLGQSIVTVPECVPVLSFVGRSWLLLILPLGSVDVCHSYLGCRSQWRYADPACNGFPTLVATGIFPLSREVCRDGTIGFYAGDPLVDHAYTIMDSGACPGGTQLSDGKQCCPVTTNAAIAMSAFGPIATIDLSSLTPPFTIEGP